MTRERIVEAACAAFAERGYRATTTREIARLAHVNEVTIYRYFHRKSDLFQEAIEILATSLANELIRLELTHTDSPEAFFQGLMENLYGWLVKERRLSRILQYSLLDRDREISSVLKSKLELVHTHFEPVFRRWIDCGRVQATNSAEAAMAFWMSVLAVLMMQSNARQLFAILGTTSDSLDKSTSEAACSWIRAYFPALSTKPQAPSASSDGRNYDWLEVE